MFSASWFFLHCKIPHADCDLLPAQLGQAFRDHVDQVVITLCTDWILTRSARWSTGPGNLGGSWVVHRVNGEHTVCFTPNALATAWCATPVALLPVFLALVAEAPRRPRDAILDGPGAGATEG